MNTFQQEPIAIVGMGCRFPGATNVQAFWQLLRNGEAAIREVPGERWNSQTYYDLDPKKPGKMVSRWGGFIDKMDCFDWQAFRISPREAKHIDPQQRLLLEVTWEALEDAGLPLEEVAGSQTSVSMGITWNDYLRLQSRDWSGLDGYATVGNLFAFAVNRISYTFDLRGPSIALDAACASSITALHYACQNLWSGEATLALAGGVELMVSPDSTIMMSKSGLLSPTGSCKTLDAQADGFVRGEGCGVLVLKRLSQVTPSDRVYALVRGMAVSHNGRNEWIMAASSSALEAVVCDAYRKTGIDPAEVDYIEMHGIGLPKGDPIEARALGAAVGTRRKHQTGQPCRVGSVKTNIGNLGAAAGVASLIKVALSLHHRELPPTLNLQHVNPDIPLDELGLLPQQRLEPWPHKDGQPLAGVTVTSFSGSNAHVILEGSFQSAQCVVGNGNASIQRDELLTLSARSAPALHALVAAYSDMLAADDPLLAPSLHDICYTASVRRSHHAHRLALVCSSRQNGAAALRMFLAGESSIAAGTISAQKSNKPVFLYSEEAGRWWAAARADLQHEPAFQAALAACDAVLRQQEQRSLLDELNTTTGETALSRPALFALQMAFTSLWNVWGCEPVAVVGQGSGEVSAAHIAGQISLHEALHILCHEFDTHNNGSNGVHSNGNVTSESQQAALPLYLLSQDDSITRLLADGYRTFLDLGTPSDLGTALLGHLEQQEQTGTVLSALRPDTGTRHALLATLGQLYIRGAAINWQAFYPEGGCCVSLPTYAWQRERLWLEWLRYDEGVAAPDNNGHDEPVADTAETSLNAKELTTGWRELVQQLERTAPERQHQLLLNYLRGHVRTLLGLPADQPLAPQQRLFEVGIDSLTAVELRNRLQTSTGHQLITTLVFDYPTIEGLADYLLRHILGWKASETGANSAAQTQAERDVFIENQITQLSEDEAEARLLEKLAAFDTGF